MGTAATTWKTWADSDATSTKWSSWTTPPPPTSSTPRMLCRAYPGSTTWRTRSCWSWRPSSSSCPRRRTSTQSWKLSNQQGLGRHRVQALPKGLLLPFHPNSGSRSTSGAHRVSRVHKVADGYPIHVPVPKRAQETWKFSGTARDPGGSDPLTWGLSSLFLLPSAHWGNVKPVTRCGGRHRGPECCWNFPPSKK